MNTRTIRCAGAQGVWGIATFTVTTLSDETNLNDETTLREAIAAANILPGEDRIEFAVSGRIELQGEPITVRDALVIDGDNDGDGSPDVTVDANGLPEGFRALASIRFDGVRIVGEGTESAPELLRVDLVPLYRFDGDSEANFLGGSVASAGDVNADGVADVVVGAVSADPNGLSGAGSAFVYASSAIPFVRSTAFTFDDPSVVLAPEITARDGDLGARNEGLGDYGGASVRFSRADGADPADRFSAVGDLEIDAGTARLDGEVVATVTQGDGALLLDFVPGTTTAQLNETIRSIAFATDTRGQDVPIEITFTDGSSAPPAVGTVTVETPDPTPPPPTARRRAFVWCRRTGRRGVM